MKLSFLNESDGLPHQDKVWQKEEHQGAKHKKHWYQQYYVKAKPYRWPKKTGGKEATGYKEHILPPGTVKESAGEEQQQRMTEKWAEELANTYISPDDIMHNGNVYETFFYLSDGQFFSKYDPEYETDTHYEMMADDGPLNDYCKKMFPGRAIGYVRNDMLHQDLLGRVGYKRLGFYDKVRVACFWNDTPGVYSNLLEPCIKALIERDFLDDDSFISTPIHKTVPVSTILGGKAETKEMTDEEQTDYELYKKLHQLRGQEKHDAMKKLKVGGGGKPHPMQQAMSKTGLIGPGQKWWAMHSEEKQKVPYHVKKSGDGYKVFSPNGAKSKKPMSKKKAEDQQAAIYANTKGEDIAVALSKMIGEETVTLQLDCETYNEVVGLLAGGHTLDSIIENKMGITGWKGTMMLSQLVMTH